MSDFLDDFRERFKHYNDGEIEAKSEEIYMSILNNYTSGINIPENTIRMGAFIMEEFKMSSDSAIKCVRMVEKKHGTELSDMGYRCFSR